MPIKIQIEDKTKDLQELARQLSDKNITKVNVRAINKAIQKSKTRYRREIVKQFNLTYGDTKVMVKPNNATYTNPEGTIQGATNPISLSRFNPSFISGGRVLSLKTVKNKETGRRELTRKSKRASKKDRSNGVTIEVHKGEKKNIPFAFMIDSAKPGLSKQIWARGKYQGNKFITSKSRKPITALKTVAPYGMMTEEKIQQEVKDTASDAMQKEFERQVNLQLRKAGAK